MSPLLMGDDMSLRRFHREARAAALIRSEHVVRVFDVASLDDGTPYIVMEYLSGRDLSEVPGPLPVSEAVHYLLQASEAVAEAHAAGIVHRDLKPGNLFCCERPGLPLVKVLDFGVSKLLPETKLILDDGVRTQSHFILGSPLYASPEQLNAPHRVDARTDIWALGSILYELLTGTPPFRAETLLQICAKVAHEPLSPPNELNPAVSEGLAEVIARSLAKDPDERFQSVAELAFALAPFAPPGGLISVERIARVQSGVPPSNPCEPCVLPAVPECAPTLQSESDRPVPRVRAPHPRRGDATGLSHAAYVVAGMAAGMVTVAVLAGWVTAAGRAQPSAAPAAAWAAAAAPSYVPVVAPSTSAASTLQPQPAPEEATASSKEAEPQASASSAPVPPASKPRWHAPPRRKPDTSEFGGMF
jgi:serine/threonine-protein kinase